MSILDPLENNSEPKLRNPISKNNQEMKRRIVRNRKSTNALTNNPYQAFRKRMRKEMF